MLFRSQAMENLDIEPVIYPVRGGTDGSTISYLGLPTPNLFAGGENMHSRFVRFFANHGKSLGCFAGDRQADGPDTD